MSTRKRFGAARGIGFSVMSGAGEGSTNAGVIGSTISGAGSAGSISGTLSIGKESNSVSRSMIGSCVCRIVWSDMSGTIVSISVETFGRVLSSAVASSAAILNSGASVGAGGIT